MSRRAATPIDIPSNAPKRARIALSIAGSSSTVVPSLSSAPAPAPTTAAAPSFALFPAPVAGFSSFQTPRLESSVGTEAIGAASGLTLEAMAAQVQHLSQMLQRQQQKEQASEADVEKAKKECSVSIQQIYHISNCILYLSLPHRVT